MKPLKERLEKVEVQEPVYIPTPDGKAVETTVYAKVPAWRDPVDGEIYLDDEAQQILDKVKARHMGLLTPAQLKELRLRFQLTQAQMARLCQMGEKTWTRWESGRERPSRSMNLLLRSLYDGQLDVEYLNSLQHTPDSALTARLLKQKAEAVWGVMRSWFHGQSNAMVPKTSLKARSECHWTSMLGRHSKNAGLCSANYLQGKMNASHGTGQLAEFRSYGGRIGQIIRYKAANEEVTT